MADWRDRLKPASYKSNSGAVVDFLFVEVTRSTKLRGTAFEFRKVDGAFVQRSGVGANRYPMRVIFAGEDNDIEAANFEAACLEPGIGTLNHPRYGTIKDVVPLGDLTTRTDLVRNANETIIEVTFWKTLVSAFPSSKINRQSDISAALARFDETMSLKLFDSTDLSTVPRQADMIQSFKAFLAEVNSALSGISDATDASFLSDSLDTLIGSPILLAQSIGNIIRAPSRSLNGVLARLDGYATLLANIISLPISDPTTALESGAAIPSRTNKIRNDFHGADLFVSQAIAGSVASVAATPVGGDPTQPGARLSTRPAALEAAVAVVEQFEAGVLWREEGFGALEGVDSLGEGQVDTGAAHQALQAAVAVAAGFLVEVSFSLVPERRVVLDRARTIVDLSSELYGEVDPKLDFLIRSNNLTGSEIFELPKGREIVYYP